MSEQIKKLRISAGLSQIELSEILGIKQPTVSSWEIGISVPATMLLPKLADALHCSIDALFGREPQS